MIVVSLVLILGAIVLLVLGLVNGSSGLLVGSIGTSLLAAVALIVGVRQAAAARSAAGRFADEQDNDAEPEEFAERRPIVPPRSQQRPDPELDTGPAMSAQMTAPMATVPSQAPPVREDDLDDEDPPDEPVAQRVSAAEAARVARMATEVLVIDGRPRYHVAGCVHLLGRPCEPLAVSEAVELGFTPCGLCEPDSALLADARRV